MYFDSDNITETKLVMATERANTLGRNVAGITSTT